MFNFKSTKKQFFLFLFIGVFFFFFIYNVFFKYIDVFSIYLDPPYNKTLNSDSKLLDLNKDNIITKKTIASIKHRACINNSCVLVDGSGINECNKNDDCLVSVPTLPPNKGDPNIKKSIDVYSIAYLPLNPNNTNYLDPKYVGPYAQRFYVSQLEELINDSTNELLTFLTKSTAYYFKTRKKTKPYFKYVLYDYTKFYYEPLPKGFKVPWSATAYRPDYVKILNRENICDLVDNRGIKQIWVWGYHTDKIEPSESNMSMGLNVKDYWNFKDYGDISNSERSNDLPQCKKTYVVFTYNYMLLPGLNFLVHNHMHQLENVFGFLGEINRPLGINNKNIFWDYFAGIGIPPNSNKRRIYCGNAHFPPNFRYAYDYANTDNVLSNCFEWYKSFKANKSNISCNNWFGPGDCSKDLIKSELSYYMWWMQKIPGKDNNIGIKVRLRTYYLRNWWEAIYDFDSVLESETGLFLKPKDYYRACDSNSCNLTLLPGKDDCSTSIDCFTSKNKKHINLQSSAFKRLSCHPADKNGDCVLNNQDLLYLSKLLFVRLNNNLNHTKPFIRNTPLLKELVSLSNYLKK